MGQQIKFALQQSAHRVLVALVNFLPGVVAFLLAVVVCLAIGLLLGWLTTRLLLALRFDERFTTQGRGTAFGGLADWAPSHSPTRLVSQTIFWLCLLLGVAVGISALNASLSSNSQISLFLLPYVTHAIGAVLLLTAGSLLARFLSRSILIGAVNAQLQYARFLALGVKWLMLVLAGAMALDHLGIAGAIVELAFGILFGGIVLTLSLAIGLGSRELVSRSIEKTMEKPARPEDFSPSAQTAKQTSSTTRHF